MLGFGRMAEPHAPAERTPPSERPSSLLGLLQRRYFRRLWAMTTVLALGDWIGVFALTIYVADLSDRPEFAVGGVLLFRVVPGLFFGPIAGVLADRFDRRRLMITADILRALLIGSLPWIHSLPAIYAVSAAMEVLSIMWKPAKDAAIPNLVERDQILMANQLNLISTYATFPLGGALVALLAIPAALLDDFHAFGVLKEHPVALAFWVDAAAFLFAASMVTSFPRELMKVPRGPHQDVRWNPFRDLTDGFRFVWRHRIVRLLVFGAWVAFTGGSAIVSLGPIFTNRLVAGDGAASQAAWGSLIVAVGIGLVGGMITAGAIARHIAREKIFPFGLMLSGASAVIVGSMTTLQAAIVATVGVGLGAGVAWVTIFTLLQERTDDRYRGRTFATLYTGIQLSLFVGLAGWPIIAGAVGNRTAQIGDTIIDLSGIRVVMIAGGVFLFLSGVWTLGGMRRASGVLHRSPRARGLRLSAVQGAERTGMLIAFEGGEGSGKSSQIERLAPWLRERGHQVVVTREPGGSKIGERIRAMLLDPDATEMDGKTEALLYAAARAQHVAEVVAPALERGTVVLCDRYLDSSVAYQGLARGLGEDDVLRLNTWATDETLPDIVVLLHIDPEVGLARAGRTDRIEREDIAFHRKVADAYLHLARTYPSRFTVVDASAEPDAVQQQVRAAILPYLAGR